jgi:hypothetical protein
MQKSRFICLMEPPDDSWAVWDENSNQPAFDGEPLVGLTESVATCACRMLNRRDGLWRVRTALSSGDRRYLADLISRLSKRRASTLI